MRDNRIKKRKKQKEEKFLFSDIYTKIQLFYEHAVLLEEFFKLFLFLMITICTQACMHTLTTRLIYC